MLLCSGNSRGGVVVMYLDFGTYCVTGVIVLCVVFYCLFMCCTVGEL